jgi:Mrp family chromosome partitioning ATPase
MSENCTHDCGSCEESCSSRKENFSVSLGEHSSVKKVIGVISGKGGVGKSMVASLLAVLLNRKGYNTAVLDADITGPSIPRIFGLSERASSGEFGLMPVQSKTGIQIMSINLLLENNTDPVIWRGPVLAGAVKQFWHDTVWKDVDFMFVDMPPGTGDVPLTVFQSLPVDGIVVVTSPQELVSMIVSKAVKMAGLMKIPVLGIVENMSYFTCPSCGKEHKIFGDSHIEAVAAEHGIAQIARIPINPKLAAASDRGAIELFEGNWLDAFAEKIEKL